MNCFCIIITFEPNIETLSKVIRKIRVNSTNIIIVDNGSLKSRVIKERFNNNIFISLPKNIGIASAQNIGIKKAMEMGAEYIWLSDQDTFYPADYLEKMDACIQQLKTKNIKFSVIGPAYIELNRNKLQPFIKFNPFSEKIFPKKGIVNLISHTISSGMIIPVEVFKIVGFKDESLFIDWVDFEWCWRSIIKGYQVVGNGDITIQHTFGDEVVSFFGKKIIIRSPFRHYFMIRNGIYLSLYSNDMTVPMRLEVFLKTTLWMFIFPLWSRKDKVEHFKATFLGFFHGLIARLGEK